MKKLVQMLLIFLVLPPLFSDPAPFQPDIKCYHLKMSDGLSQNAIYSIFQDRQGFMWFGTTDGLNRFDGYRFRTYLHHPDDDQSINPGWIIAIAEDAENKIWTGSIDRGISIYNPKSDAFSHLIHDPKNPNSLSSNLVLSICIDRNQQVWIATKQGLNRYDTKTKQFKHYLNTDHPGTISHNYITSAIEDRRGRLWFGTRNGLNLYNPKNDSFTRFKMGNGNWRSNYIRKLYCDSRNNLWICTYEGLFRRDAQTGLTSAFFMKKVGEGANYFWDLVEDSQGIIWFSVSNDGKEGIWCMNPETRQMKQFKNNLLDPNSLSDNHILRLYKDRSGTLWAGSWTSGLNYFYPSQAFDHLFRSHDHQTKLIQNKVFAITQDQADQLWVGIYNGGIFRFNQQSREYHQITPPAGIPNTANLNKIYSLYHDQQDSLWIGYRRLGLGRYHLPSNQFRLFTPEQGNPNSLGSFMIRCIYEDSNNRLWIGTYSDLNRWVPEKEHFVRYRHDPKNSNSIGGIQISDISEDPSRNIWAATSNGISRIDPFGRITRFLYRSRDPITINAISVGSKKNILWLGSQYHGLLELNSRSGQYSFIELPSERMGRQIQSIIRDRNSLWITTNNGLAKFNIKSRRFRVYKQRDGVDILEFTSAAHRDSNGKIYFGGTNGMVSFHPERIQSSGFMAPVVISSLKIFPAKKQISDISRYRKLDLSYRDTTLFFEFASLDFRNPGGNQFAYKIEPITAEWIQLGNKHDLTLSNLGHGDYVLKIKGTNADGIWSSKAVSLSLSISPPFWGTLWFRVLVILCLFALIYYWHTIRMKRQEIRLRMKANSDRFCQKYKITGREKEIIELIIQGKSNQEIEELLFISYGTVKNHIYNIYRKLDIKNRTQLATMLSDWKKNSVE